MGPTDSCQLQRSIFFQLGAADFLLGNCLNSPSFACGDSREPWINVVSAGRNLLFTTVSRPTTLDCCYRRKNLWRSIHQQPSPSLTTSISGPSRQPMTTQTVVPHTHTSRWMASSRQGPSITPAEDILLFHLFLSSVVSARNVVANRWAALLRPRDGPRALSCQRRP